MRRFSRRQEQSDNYAAIPAQQRHAINDAQINPPGTTASLASETVQQRYSQPRIPARASNPTPNYPGLNTASTNSPAVQQKTDGRSSGSPAPEAVRSQLGVGQPLDHRASGWAGRSLQHDLSQVEVHPESATAERMGARALTVGSHIAFAPGQYRPGTPSGDRLIAHELTHVVQQSGAAEQIQAADAAADKYEAEADQASNAMLAGEPVARISSLNRLDVQGWPPEEEPVCREPEFEIEAEEPVCRMPEASVSLEQSLAQRYPALVRALPEGDFRELIDAGNISVTLDTLLDADTRFIDVDVWSQIYNKFMQLDGNTAGRLARNEINRRWFQENSIDPASDEVQITVRTSGTNPILDLRFSSIQLTLGSEGLLTLAGLDEALQVIPLNVIASEVGEQVMALGEAAELTLRSDRLAANVPSYAQRVRANFEDHSLDEIRHQIRNVRSLRQRAVQLSGNEIAAAYIQGLTTEYDTTLQTLESLLSDARRWHASHQPEMTNQEAYEWAGTELVTYAGREWEQGGLGYVTGGAGYAGGFVVALFEGLGNLFTFGYQSARGDIVTAYRRGHVSYTTMEELSEDAAIRSFAVGVVTVALTVATAGLGAGVAGAFGLARGTLGFAIVSGGTEGALINIGSLGYETLITESRPEFEDPYAQAIWQRGSHSAGEFALAGGLGFGMGGLLGARSYYRGLGQSSALALPEEAGLAQPEIFPGGELPPAWEIRPMGVDPSGMERYVGRHISGEIIELFINAQHTEGYIVRQATGEIFQYQAGTFTRAAGLLPGQTGAAAAAGEAGLTRAPLIIRGGGAIYVEGFGPPPGAAPAGTITPVLPAPSRAPLMLPRGVAPGQAPINVLPSRAPLPGQPAAYSLPLGESGTAGAILMNRGLRPADFNMSFIAEDPVMLQLWDSARTAARSTGRSNAYTRYLEAMTQGNSMTSQQLRDAFGVVQDRFLELARARGFDVATVHHWNFPLSRYPQLITDPRHLVPVFEQSQMRGGYHPVHQGGLHRLTTSNPSQPTAGPVAPVHEIVLPPE